MGFFFGDYEKKLLMLTGVAMKLNLDRNQFKCRVIADVKSVAMST